MKPANNKAKALPNLVVIDFETTGLDPKTDKPVEVCAFRVVDGEVTSVFNTLVFYDGAWEGALTMKTNRHSKEDLLKGMDAEIMFYILYQFIGDDTIVAYNALFDLEFLLEGFKRYNLTDEITNPFICPLTIARDRHPYPHKLGDMCKLYGIELPEAHLAYDDTLALVNLMLTMHQKESILPYVNVAGYKRQYGAPKWLPAHATLKAQGNETVYHDKDGSAKKQTNVGKPFARLKPTVSRLELVKPYIPLEPVQLPKLEHPKLKLVTEEDVEIDLAGGFDGQVLHFDTYNSWRVGNPFKLHALNTVLTIRNLFVYHESETHWAILEHNGHLYSYDLPYVKRFMGEPQK